MEYILIGFVLCFMIGYAAATAKYGGMSNIGTLWIDGEMPIDRKPLLYLELQDGVEYFMDDKYVMMDVRVVQDERASRE